MKYFFYFVAVLTVFTPMTTIHASERVPFGHQVFQVQNYSRATDQIAISGLIGDGGIKSLASHGFKTIIDMRTANEGTADEKALVDVNGMNYINIPMTVAGISEEQLSAFTKAIESAENLFSFTVDLAIELGPCGPLISLEKAPPQNKRLKQAVKRVCAPRLKKRLENLLSISLPSITTVFAQRESGSKYSQDS